MDPLSTYRPGLFARQTLLMTVLAIAGHGVVHAEGVVRSTFTRDVAPILQGHCQKCHRPGQIGPMSLLTYEEARPWAKSIKREVLARTMPPFHATGPIGKWLDDPRLTPEQIETMVAWVDQGAPRGNPEDLPEPIEWFTGEWPLGEPDRILEFPEHVVRDDNVDDYIYLFSEYVFEEDTWVKGVAWKFSDYKMVHHATSFQLGPGEKVPASLKMKRELNTRRLPGRGVMGWLPGTENRMLPEHQAILFPKGTRVVCVVHCAPTTDAKAFRTSMGLYTAPPGTYVSRKRVPLRVDPASFYLKANQSDFRVVQTKVMPEDALVTHYAIHMHYRGVSTKLTYRYPDGTSETAIDVPNFDFGWQRFYYLTEPKRVPKGTIIEYVAVWDNSADNPNNPDPSQEVFWGPLTSDEMGSGSVRYVPAAEMDKLLNGTD